MDSQKLECVEDVFRIVRDISKTVFNITSDEQMKNIFGMSNEEMKTVIQKVIDALPDDIFLPAYRKKLEEVKAVCAREFIFFQLQERYKDPHYLEHLKSFIKLFCRDIQN